MGVTEEKSTLQRVGEMDIMPIEEIYEAQKHLPKEITDTPLVKLNVEVPGKEIYLKLENFQPIGCFKIRGAYNALRKVNREIYDEVVTVSTGNFAQGLAWASKKFGFKCTTIVPKDIPNIKVNALEGFGAKIIKVTSEEWWDILQKGETDLSPGKFIHTCCEYDAIAGNGVIGLELVKSLGHFDTVIIPVGGGSNITGTTSAIKQLLPNVKSYACEVDNAAPVHASFCEGAAAKVKNWLPSYVDGMNGKLLMPSVWNMIKNLVEGVELLDLKTISDTVRMLVMKNKIVTEGAGAAPVAAAMSDQIPPGRIVCIISGGNLDNDKLVKILNGEVP